MKNTYLFLLAVLLNAGCGKQIPGPEGPKGPQGPKGITGKDGATILSGATTPSSNIGKTGDFYLDLSSGVLYGPKTEEGWGKPISLKGEQGSPGNDGASFIGGDGVPSESTGKLGDYYFDKTNLAIFGPKTQNGWGSPISLKTPEQNGVKVFFKDNVQFENLVKEPNFIDYNGDVVPSNTFNSEITFKIDGLADYVEKGLVFVYIKRQDTYYWSDRGDSVNPEWWWSHSLFDDYAEFGISIEKPEIKPSGITLRCSISEWNRTNPDSYRDINTAADRKLLSESFVFDIKIVLIPASSVEYLSSVKPSIPYSQQIATFLGL